LSSQALWRKVWYIIFQYASAVLLAARQFVETGFISARVQRRFLSHRNDRMALAKSKAALAFLPPTRAPLPFCIRNPCQGSSDRRSPRLNAAGGVYRRRLRLVEMIARGLAKKKAPRHVRPFFDQLW
jgi:hypothetical protein